MEVCHQKKFQKYEPLSASIKSNGRSVHHFANGVGVRGHCPTTVKSCLFCQSFSGKQLKSTIKQISFSSLKASLQIW